MEKERFDMSERLAGRIGIVLLLLCVLVLSDAQAASVTVVVDGRSPQAAFAADEIEEDGTVYISCLGGDGHLKAKEYIESLTQPPQVGRIYDKSRVVSVKDFGAFVEITPGVEGLCHISDLSDGFVKNVEDVCKVGDEISVKLLSVDDQGRLKLSRRAALAKSSKRDDRRPVGKK